MKHRNEKLCCLIITSLLITPTGLVPLSNTLKTSSSLKPIHNISEMFPIATPIVTLTKVIEVIEPEIVEPKSSYIDIPLDHKYQDLVIEMEELLGISRYEVYGFMYSESSFDHSSTSEAGAKGIMQMLQPTYNWTTTQIEITHPELSNRMSSISDIESNIIAGIYHISYIKSTAPTNISGKELDAFAMTAYNRSITNANKYFQKHGNYNSSYANKVMRYQEIYRNMGETIPE